MLRLPFGLFIFIPEVRFDRSAADWLWEPQEQGKEGTRTKAGSHRAGKFPPLFSARLIIPFHCILFVCLGAASSINFTH